MGLEWRQTRKKLKTCKSWEKTSKRDRAKQREVLGPHHRSPTHIPSTSLSLHYLHVNDSSLCPTEGRKRPINTTAQKARTLFNPRRVDLLHPHTPTHVEAHSNTQSPKCSQQVEQGWIERRWAWRMVIQEEESLICCTQGEGVRWIHFKALIVWLWVWTTGNMFVLFRLLLTLQALPPDESFQYFTVFTSAFL